MRTVQQVNLTFAVWCHIVGHYYVKSGLSQRQIFGNPCRTFDNPEQERLSGNDQLVEIAELFFQLGCFVARVSRHDPVHQTAAERVLFHEPLSEGIAELPFRSILLYDLQQLLAVTVNQLAGDNDETLFTQFKTSMEQRSQLSREALRRRIV
ncbi:hypothetical protein D3C73_1256250 [compost metagenome]